MLREAKSGCVGHLSHFHKSISNIDLGCQYTYADTKSWLFSLRSLRLFGAAAQRSRTDSGAVAMLAELTPNLPVLGHLTTNITGHCLHRVSGCKRLYYKTTQL